MAKLDVNIGALQLKNPVMTASGTFGYGLEFADFIDLSGLGGIIVKGTTYRRFGAYSGYRVEYLVSERERRRHGLRYDVSGGRERGESCA